MKFEVLDPRGGKFAEAAALVNDKIFAENSNILGIEVTVATLANRCSLGNIDPQHGFGSYQDQTMSSDILTGIPATHEFAAIETAMGWELPPTDTTLVTVRPDLDSVGSMAVIKMRLDGTLESVYQDQDTQYLFDTGVAIIAAVDKFAVGKWKSKFIPTAKQPWDKNDFSETVAIAAAVADFKIPLEMRVQWMQDWLLTRAEPAGYREQVETERAAMIKAIENDELDLIRCSSGSIVNEVGGESIRNGLGLRLKSGDELGCNRYMADMLIVVVVSTHRFATTLGYHRSPIVVALNPEFKIGEGEPHRKFTVCQYQAGFVDLQKVQAELNELEPGWGGSPTIIGSPQGTNSTITVEKILKIVEKNLLQRFYSY